MKTENSKPSSAELTAFSGSLAERAAANLAADAEWNRQRQEEIDRMVERERNFLANDGGK